MGPEAASIGTGLETDTIEFSPVLDWTSLMLDSKTQSCAFCPFFIGWNLLLILLKVGARVKKSVNSLGTCADTKLSDL